MPSHTTPDGVEDVVAGSVEKLRALGPVLLALGTLFVAAMQVVNGLPVDQIAETLVVGWLLLTPVAALLLWPTPSFLPVPGDGDGGADASDSDALDRLKRRYADGEIDAAEFERRVETLLTADAAGRDGTASGRRDVDVDHDRAARDTADPDAPVDHDTALERP